VVTAGFEKLWPIAFGFHQLSSDNLGFSLASTVAVYGYGCSQKNCLLTHALLI
jgi:hypothetical protein